MIRPRRRAGTPAHRSLPDGSARCPTDPPGIRAVPERRFLPHRPSPDGFAGCRSGHGHGRATTPADEASRHVLAPTNPSGARAGLRHGLLAVSLSIAAAVGAAATVAGGAARAQAPQGGPTNDLEVGIAFISEGDFEAAAETLEAVTFILDGQPQSRSDAARAAVYLGWALLYTDSEAAAMQRFYDARRSDPRFVPPPTQFPRRVIRLWNAAGTRASRPTLPPPAPVEAPDPRADLSEFRGAPVDPAAWLARRGDRLVLQLALAGADQPCPGELVVDGARERLAWTPLGTAGACPAAFAEPFARVESVGAAGEGGVAIHAGAGDGGRRLFIPRPFAAWYDRGARGRSHLFLPPEATVANRLAVRELLRALGRPASSAWSFYGSPVDVPAVALLAAPSTYDGRAVSTRGRFARGGSRDAPTYSLAAQGAVIGLAPAAETQALIADNADALAGTAITVTGVFRRQRTGDLTGGAPAYSISFWSAQSDVLTATSGAAQPLSAGLGSARDVDVIGQFRASNLFGDVPPRSRRSGGREHWVLRDGDVSAWVTGSRPRGDGWELDMRSKRDSTTWMRVRGRVSEDDDVYYLDPSEVAPAQPLWSQRSASPGMLGWGPLPPDVQFALPMEFEGAQPDSLFEVQFTKPVDPATLEGNVELRYRGAGGSDFAWASLEYAEERRSLHVDPGAALRSGRVFEIVLRPGITDQSGAPLPGARTLAWRVAGG